MKWAVIQFPGSNCDQDTYRAFDQLSDVDVTMHWHEEPLQPGQYSVIALPGGFSFGDYLRAGALAKISKALENLSEVVEKGAHCIGICNGFQVLLESRLLPGNLIINQKRSFISDTVTCKIEKEVYPWFDASDVGKELRLPIAHRFGNFQASPMHLQEVDVAISYVDNPNGSVKDIAGVYRKHGEGSFFGLMPHPERASFEKIRLNDGALFWKNAVDKLKAGAAR